MIADFLHPLKRLQVYLQHAYYLRMSAHLYKLAGVGLAALSVLFMLVYLPSVYTFFGSFLTIALAVWYAEREVTTKIPCWNHAVLVTGCDTGFGHELAHHLSNLGVLVFAGCLDSEGEGAKALRTALGDKVHVLQLDVTSDDQVAKALKYVKEHKPRRGLWGIVNNAGLNFNGDVELTTMAQFEKQTQINYLGVVRVTKAFLPLIRRSQGRIVNVSSVKGAFSCPYIGAYGATKHAVEAFSDCLRLEMRPWGVSVSIVQPGNYGGATKAIEMGRMKSDYEAMWAGLDTDQKEDYGRAYIDAHLARLEAAGPTASFNINPVIHAMTDALFDVSPKRRYLVAGSSSFYDTYKWIVLAVPYVPTCIMDRYLIWKTSGLVPEGIKNI